MSSEQRLQQQPTIDWAHVVIGMMQQTKAEMQNKLQQLSTHVEALEKELRNSKEGEKKALAELSTRLGTNEAKTTGLETKMTGLETKMTGIEDVIAGLNMMGDFDDSSFFDPSLME